MSDQLQGGQAPIADSFLQINDPQYRAVESSIVKFDYDPRAATQAIDALGFAKRVDGFFYDGSGQKLTIESRTNARDDLKREDAVRLG